MTILVFEDNDEKFNDLRSQLIVRGVTASRVKRARSTAEFSSYVNTHIDLCIIDVMMPNMAGGGIRNAGLEALSMLDFAGKTKVPVLAITAFADDLHEQSHRYSERGCIIFDYHNRTSWLAALDVYLAMARDQGRYQFIIFTALKSERDAFLKLPGIQVDSTIRYGIDHWDFTVGEAAGTIVLLPQMGIVCAASVVAKVLDRYTPEVVGMCGICAGLSDSTELGQLLIVDVCWEYQSGKWLNDVFLAEPYQVSIKHSTRSALSKLLEKRTLLMELEADYDGVNRPSRRADPKFSVFTSGSAVIASEARLEHVKQQHRKVSGLDMEVYGFLKAVELSGKEVQSFGVKTVVDKADSKKGDDLHEYGCFLSAKFALMCVKELGRAEAAKSTSEC